jgi:cytochrome c-type biogenesis protein CcmH
VKSSHSTIFIVLILLIYTGAGAATATLDGVASKLSCYCGTCPHLAVSQCTCSKADEIKAEIKQKIAQGMTEQQIINSFVAEHGQTVLSAPPKSGFNLSVWMIPFLAFVLGGIVLFAFLRNQQRPPDDQPPTGPSKMPDQSHADEEYRQRLNDELEQRK